MRVAYFPEPGHEYRRDGDYVRAARDLAARWCPECKRRIDEHPHGEGDGGRACHRYPEHVAKLLIESGNA